jgi:hypothetical protein
VNKLQQTIYDEMVTIARQKDLPNHYAADLYIHDKKWLEKWDGGPFWWMLRTSGTHVLSHSDFSFDKAIRNIRLIFGDEDMILYLCTGKKLEFIVDLSLDQEWVTDYYRLRGAGGDPPELVKAREWYRISFALFTLLVV